jgi:hypothetical protein
MTDPTPNNLPGPEPLSPAAQAVLDAYETTYTETGLVAAIFELADQLQLALPLGDTDADAGVFAAHHAICAQILAIATELEAHG